MLSNFQVESAGLNHRHTGTSHLCNRNYFFQVQKNIALAQNQQKQRYQRKKNFTTFNIKVGDVVLKKNDARHKGLQNRWVGPYRVH